MLSQNTSKILPRSIASLKNLKEFWNTLPQNKRPKKIKGKFFKENIDVMLSTISQKLINGKYEFKKLDFKPIPKGENSYRIICSPDISDRFVQRFILNKLTNPDRLKVGNNISYGSLKGRGVHAAVEQAMVFRKQFSWALKTDISSFFDKINRNQLIEVLNRKLRRSSLFPLLKLVISCEIKDAKTKEHREILKNSGIKTGNGLRQGMPLSPFLSNFFLMSFDKTIIRKSFKAIRYVDDIIVFCNSEKECKNIEKIITMELKKLQLSIPSLIEAKSKTQMIKPHDPVIFLGFEIYKSNNGMYLKKIPKKTITRCLDDLEKYSDYKKSLEAGLTFITLFRRLDSKLKGYESAFKGASNLKEFLDFFKRDVDKLKKRLIDDMFGIEIFSLLSKEKKKFLGFETI